VQKILGMGTPANSAASILSQLDISELEQRLEENFSERKALLVLLRAARAADRRREQSEEHDGK
jgi:hypothetical protein